jgi:hypothetical protein
MGASQLMSGTTGNSSTKSIGLGELIYRPSPKGTRFKVTFVRDQAQD